MAAFKVGAFRTAVSTGVPIVPIVVSDWYQNVDVNKFSAGEIKIKILPEISTEGLTSEDALELSNKTRELMESEIGMLNQARESSLNQKNH